MLKYRRQAHFEAWYGDPDEDLPRFNPFRRYRSRAEASKPASPILTRHHSLTDLRTSAVGQSVQVTPDQLQARLVSAQNVSSLSPSTSPDDIEARAEKQITYRRRYFSSLFHRLIQTPADKAIREPDAPSHALGAANREFRELRRDRSAFVVSEIGPLNDPQGRIVRERDKSRVRKVALDDNGKPAISMKELKELHGGLGVMYILDSKPAAQAVIDHYFSSHANNPGWQRFRKWVQLTDTGRGAARRVAEWAPLKAHNQREWQFAVGFEHCPHFDIATHGNPDLELVNAAANAKHHGVYEESDFALVHQNPRRTIYFHQGPAQARPNETDEVSKRLSRPDPMELPLERIIIISQSRPYHLTTGDAYHKTWQDESIWVELLERTKQRRHPLLFESSEVQYFVLARDIMLNVVVDTYEAWNAQVVHLNQQLEELESQIYENPSNDSLSGVLWSLSKHLNEVQQSIGLHAGLAESLQSIMNKYAADHEDWVYEDEKERWQNLRRHTWLKDNIKELEALAENVRNDLIRPVDHMIDLMYKSVSIRDARLSLELNASLWRLSWITFIFLPLTFLSGFFGMNVDTFKKNPSIKWYFFTAIPFMIMILLGWLAFKHFLSQNLRTRTSKKLNISKSLPLRSPASPANTSTSVA